MVEIDKVVLANVKEFLRRLDTAGIHVTKAYLFCSYEPLPFNPAGFTKNDPLVREIAKKGFDILKHKAK